MSLVWDVLIPAYNAASTLGRAIESIKRQEVPPREIRELFRERTERSIQRDIKQLIERNLVRAVGEARAVRYCMTDESMPES